MATRCLVGADRAGAPPRGLARGFFAVAWLGTGRFVKEWGPRGAGVLRDESRGIVARPVSERWGGSMSPKPLETRVLAKEAKGPKGGGAGWQRSPGDARGDGGADGEGRDNHPVVARYTCRGRHRPFAGARRGLIDRPQAVRWIGTPGGLPRGKMHPLVTPLGGTPTGASRRQLRSA